MTIDIEDLLAICQSVGRREIFLLPRVPEDCNMILISLHFIPNQEFLEKKLVKFLRHSWWWWLWPTYMVFWLDIDQLELHDNSMRRKGRDCSSIKAAITVKIGPGNSGLAEEEMSNVWRRIKFPANIASTNQGDSSRHKHRQPTANSSGLQLRQTYNLKLTHPAQVWLCRHTDAPPHLMNLYQANQADQRKLVIFQVAESISL